MKFSAKWLPGGSIELEAMPLQGDREIREMALKDAELQSIYSANSFLSIARAILAASRVLGNPNFGVKGAKEMWDGFVASEFGSAPLFTWSQESFTENLTTTKENFLYRQLECQTDEEAKLKLEEFAKNLEERAKAVKKEDVDRLRQRPLLSLYWRLRNSGVKSILTPTGEQRIDWGLEKRAETIEILESVVTSEDIESIQEKPKRPLDVGDLKPQSVADVEGKSVTVSAPLTQLSPGSEPSSVSFTVPAAT